MTLARMYYEDTGLENQLTIHVFDGTVRDVVFQNAAAKAAALVAGRAAIDCTAIEIGLLPRGATLVSRASASDATSLIEELRDPTDPAPTDQLAAIRLAFSMKLRVERSERIDDRRDAETRRTDQFAARRYDGIVDALIAAMPEAGEGHG